MTNQYSIQIISTLGTGDAPPNFTALIRQSGRTTIEVTDTTRHGMIRQIAKTLLERERYFRRLDIQRGIRNAKRTGVLIRAPKPIKRVLRTKPVLVLQTDCEVN
jgi:hypothetical protein